MKPHKNLFLKTKAPQKIVQVSDNVILSHNIHAYEYVALMKANEPETAYDETP